MNYKLFYFPIRGRGEQVRLYLHALAQPFENIIVNREAFLRLKQQGAGTLYFGSLPMLEDGDFRLCQGPVILSYLASRHDAAPSDPRLSAKADAIAWGAEDLRTRYFKLFGEDRDKARADFVNGEWQSRWLPNLEELLGINGGTGYFVGDRLTHADIAVWDILNAILEYIPGTSLDDHAALTAFYASVRERPEVAAYIASRTV
jgi:glutathione S-transferase